MNEREDRAPCFATAMRKASRRLTQLYDDALARANLRSTQYAILSHLARWPGEAPTVAELARKMVMDRSAMGHNLRPLERDGLLRLEVGSKDQRQRRIVATAKGKLRYTTARVLWKRAQERIADVLGASEADRLREVLLAVAHNERLATLKD